MYSGKNFSKVFYPHFQVCHNNLLYYVTLCYFWSLCISNSIVNSSLSFSWLHLFLLHLDPSFLLHFSLHCHLNQRLDLGFYLGVRPYIYTHQQFNVVISVFGVWFIILYIISVFCSSSKTTSLSLSIITNARRVCQF